MFKNLSVARIQSFATAGATELVLAPGEAQAVLGIGTPFNAFVSTPYGGEAVVVTEVLSNSVVVQRGAEGSTAIQVPPGSLLVAGVTAAILSAVTPNTVRVVTQCPNYYIMPNYIGEIVYQTGSLPCQKKVWVAVSGTEARWQIIGGHSCLPAEDWQEQGWNWQTAPGGGPSPIHDMNVQFYYEFDQFAEDPGRGYLEDSSDWERAVQVSDDSVLNPPSVVAFPNGRSGYKVHSGYDGWSAGNISGYGFIEAPFIPPLSGIGTATVFAAVMAGGGSSESSCFGFSAMEQPGYFGPKFYVCNGEVWVGFGSAYAQYIRSLSGPTILTARMSFAECSLRVNGVVVPPSSSSSGSSYTNTCSHLLVSLATELGGAEIALCSYGTIEEIEAVEQYLAAKYGVTLG